MTELTFIHPNTHTKRHKCYRIFSFLTLKPALHEFHCMFRQWQLPPSFWAQSCLLQTDDQLVWPQALHHSAMQCFWAGISPGGSGLCRGRHLFKTHTYCKNICGGELPTCLPLCPASLRLLVHIHKACVYGPYSASPCAKQSNTDTVLRYYSSCWNEAMQLEAICVKCLIYF